MWSTTPRRLTPINAHYTDARDVTEMRDALTGVGFESGQVLDANEAGSARRIVEQLIENEHHEHSTALDRVQI